MMKLIPTIFILIQAVAQAHIEYSYELQMTKGTECKFNKKKGESVTKKLGKKKDAEMKPLKRCKSWCIDEGGVSCGYDSKKRLCTVYKSGFKGSVAATSASSYCGTIAQIETEHEEEEEEIAEEVTEVGVGEEAPEDAEEEESVVEEEEEVQCTLTAHLGYPYDDPDEAAYYGYHAENLQVTMVGDDWWVCSWYYSDDLPEWCTYQNTDPVNGDSAYVANLEDYYYDDIDDIETLTEETVVITGAAGKSYEFLVETYLFPRDYYTTYETWADHMNVATLTIETESGSLSAEGWSYGAEKDISTHIKQNGKWIPNPDYEGEFTVTVTCSDECECVAAE